jgi:hypothetical protein
MANLTQPLAIKGKYNEKKIKSVPMGAVKLYRGAIVVLTTAGYANKPTNTAGERMLGVALETVDNSGGSSGDKEIRVATDGIWNFAKSGTITQANAGQAVYASDDQTVYQTVNNNLVGKVSHVESVGDSSGTIWYDISEACMAQDGAGARDERIIVIPVPVMANIATGTIKVPVGYPFTYVALNWRQGIKPVTTAAKAATAQAQISGVACTGGAVALTSAACTPAGAQVAGSAITALNTGGQADTLEVAFSGVTAFAEGDGWFEATVAKR